MIEVQTLSSIGPDENRHEVVIVGPDLDPAELYKYTPRLPNGYRRVGYDVTAIADGAQFKVCVVDRRVKSNPLPPDADEPICV